MKNIVTSVYKNRQNYIIIGLTGKSGSGCTTAANFISMEKEDIILPEICINENSTNTDRKKYIIQKYFNNNWNRFTTICVRDIITTFVLNNTFEELVQYVTNKIGTEIDISNIKLQYDEVFELNKKFLEVLKNYKNNNRTSELEVDFFSKYVTNILPEFTSKIKEELSHEKYRQFSKAFQIFGDNIRKSGCAINDSFSHEHVYSLAERINIVIKIFRKYNELHGKKDFFVIDALRNPFESMFFREKYSAFYLMAIKSPQEDRYDRLFNEFNLTKSEIDEQDIKEDPEEGVIDNVAIFVSQNISACIQKADIHINNPGKYGSNNYNELKFRLITYICLIQHPGLITPERDEKLMQIAFTAKLNSGCISRQVGAVVTNKEGATVAIGWNDAPEGQTPCLLRSLDHLYSGTDPNSYSEFEKTDKKFKELTNKKIAEMGDKSKFEGLQRSFCFKSYYNTIKSDKNQVHTRALHGEENAFLQIVKHGGQSVKGGTLYTTSSSCELCSKKAYQLGITRIVYIEPYPGIAISHVVHSGTQQPEMVLFSGAIGQAYSKLYDPIFPFKDELNAIICEQK